MPPSVAARTLWRASSFRRFERSSCLATRASLSFSSSESESSPKADAADLDTPAFFVYTLEPASFCGLSEEVEGLDGNLALGGGGTGGADDGGGGSGGGMIASNWIGRDWCER
eukprot:m.16744 g.16744  ORF g.16744 m.16744 type:complete len:113 (+) comp11177_c0_seq1:228-566(+)